MKRAARLIVWTAALWVGVGVVTSARAEMDAAARGRTVALFTYRKDGEVMRFAASLNGVMVSPRHVVTSAAALSRGSSTLFGGDKAAAPDRIVAALFMEGEPLIFRVTVVPMKDGGPVQLLEVSAEDRAAVAQAVKGGPRLTGAEDDATPGRAVGVFAPNGLQPGAIDGQVLPRPYEIELRRAEAVGVVGLNVQASPLKQTLPMQVAGAGVWVGPKLVGLVVRHEGSWWVVDHEEFGAVLKVAMPADPGPTVVTPIPTPTPIPPTPTVRVPQSPPLPAGMARLITEAGAKPVLDSGLIDYVQQDQADMAMALIAGGKPAKAVELVDDILFLARDRLAEQLSYRRALALALMGQAKKALPDAQKMTTAQDPQVRGRAKLLAEVLDLSPDGQFEGKPLTDPAAFKAAAVAAVAKFDKRLRAKAEDVGQLKPINEVSYNSAMERIDELTAELNEMRYAWPGHFDELADSVAKMKSKSAIEHLGRGGQGLRQWRQTYDTAAANAQVVSGAEWSKPGYWPPDQVRAANTAVDQFNSLLTHYLAVEKTVPAADRPPLDDDLRKPLDPLTEAEQRGGAR